MLALLATAFASLGNITAAHNTGKGTSVTTINAWAMLYGTSGLFVVSLILGVEYQFDFSAKYLGALFYLAIPGSILTFAGYLRLITTLGPDKAAYMSMIVPVIALILSSVYEGYQWTLAAVVGIILVLAGNWWAMRK